MDDTFSLEIRRAGAARGKPFMILTSLYIGQPNKRLKGEPGQRSRKTWWFGGRGPIGLAAPLSSFKVFVGKSQRLT